MAYSQQRIDEYIKGELMTALQHTIISLRQWFDDIMHDEQTGIELTPDDEVCMDQALDPLADELKRLQKIEQQLKDHQFICDSLDILRDQLKSLKDRAKIKNKEIGRVLDDWESLPNDIKTDPGFKDLHESLVTLREIHDNHPW
jgi:exonuclease V gamma subunit